MSGLQLAFKADDLVLGVPDQITLTVSFLALLVSAASALATWRTNSRQSQHQERLVNLENARQQDRQRQVSGLFPWWVLPEPEQLCGQFTE